MGGTVNFADRSRVKGLTFFGPRILWWAATVKRGFERDALKNVLAATCCRRGGHAEVPALS